MNTETFKTNLAQKLKSLKPDYDKIRAFTKEQCDLLVVGLRNSRFRVLPIHAVGCVVYAVERYLEVKPLSEGLPITLAGRIFAARNVNNFTSKICQSLPLAKRDLVEQAVRLGMRDWLVAVWAENKKDDPKTL